MRGINLIILVGFAKLALSSPILHIDYDSKDEYYYISNIVIGGDNQTVNL